MAGIKDYGDVPGGGISRARFLKLAGLGAGISLLPPALIHPNAAIAQAIDGPDILAADGRYPIVAWWPPPPVSSTDPDPAIETARRYEELAGAGFNAAIGGNGVSSNRANRLALDACAPLGLRLVLADGALRNAIDGTATAPSARSEVEEEPQGVLQALTEQDSQQGLRAQAAGDQDAVRQRIAELYAEFGDSAKYPALAGIALYDEPHKGLFGTLRYAKDQVGQQFGGDELTYVNVWPSYASPKNALGTKSYTEYLERYMNERRYSNAVAPPVLSFDHYPLLSDGRTTANFFYNHAVIRRFALRFGVPSWGFVQSMGFDGRNVGLGRRRRPDEAEIFWQINVALAYGVKGIQYFTYWTPDNNQVKFGNALISRDREKTALYGYATRANGFLRKVGAILLPMTSISVAHFGEKRLPRGAKRFRGNSYVKDASGDPAILGLFLKPDAPDARYLLVVNRSPNRSSKTRLTVTGAVKRVRAFDPSADAFTPTKLAGDPPRRFNSRLGAGRARLYQLSTA